MGRKLRPDKKPKKKFDVVYCGDGDEIQPFGLFYGMMLAQREITRPIELCRVRDTPEFYADFCRELEQFLAENEYSIESIELWFKWYDVYEINYKLN